MKPSGEFWLDFEIADCVHCGRRIRRVGGKITTPRDGEYEAWMDEGLNGEVASFHCPEAADDLPSIHMPVTVSLEEVVVELREMIEELS